MIMYDVDRPHLHLGQTFSMPFERRRFVVLIAMLACLFREKARTDDLKQSGRHKYADQTLTV